MPNLNQVDRAGIVEDLLKDADVTDINLYAGLDKVGGPKVVSHAEAFWRQYGPDTEKVTVDGVEVEVTQPVSNPTNAQKCKFMMKRVLLYVKDVVLTDKINTARDAAITAAKATAEAETNADFGSGNGG